MGISQGLLLCIILYTVDEITQVHCQMPFCIFGSDSNCLLPCRCSSSCDRITGQCSDKQCAQDPFLKDQQLDGRTYWTGDACQTGDVGRGKHTEQPGTYYNPGFKTNATADKAVDGNLSTYAYSRTSSYGWWMVDLEVEHDIEEVYITTNNLGNSLILLTNYSVWLGNDTDVFAHSLCGLAPSPLVPGYNTPLQWNKVVCNKEHRRGRYLSIRKSEGDSSKGWIPIHEAVIIGSPVSSVRLGYCIKYDEMLGDGLKHLKCEECAEGWLLPDCQHSSHGNATAAGYSSTRAAHSSTSDATLSVHYSSTTSSSTASSTLKTSTSTLNSTVKTATESVTDIFPISSDNGGSSVGTWIIIASSFAVLGTLLLVAVVIILVMCCRRRRFQKSQTVSQTNQGPVYFKPDHRNSDTKANNYESLLKSNVSPHAFAGVRPTNEDGTGYQTIALEGRPERYTNPIHDGHREYIGRGSDTYNYTDTFVDGGYLKPMPRVKAGEKSEGYIEITGKQNEHNGETDIYHTIPDNGINL